MKLLLLMILGLSFNLAQAMSVKTLTLSRKVFQRVPFSSQYSEEGALIRNVYYPAVNDLIPQLNKLYQLDLEDRKEAHITVVTPPEYQKRLKDLFTVNDILSRYQNGMQGIPFEVVCVGSRKSSTSSNRVFYLVVKSPKLLNLRFDLAKVAGDRALEQGRPMIFQPEVFWPHITIGYEKGDVFEFSKGPESCLPGVKLVLSN
jgi:2'-5' RNA ligase